MSKKAETRFSLQFSRTSPDHLQVVDILNKLGRSFKAQYIVDAVLYYDKREELETQRPTLDEKQIEAIVNKILHDREESNTGPLTAGASVSQIEKPLRANTNDTNIVFNEAVEALGRDGFNAIAGTLNMFRKR